MDLKVEGSVKLVVNYDQYLMGHCPEVSRKSNYSYPFLFLSCNRNFPAFFAYQNCTLGERSAQKHVGMPPSRRLFLARVLYLYINLSTTGSSSGIKIYNAEVLFTNPSQALSVEILNLFNE